MRLVEEASSVAGVLGVERKSVGGRVEEGEGLGALLRAEGGEEAGGGGGGKGKALGRSATPFTPALFTPLLPADPATASSPLVMEDDAVKWTRGWDGDSR